MKSRLTMHPDMTLREGNVIGKGGTVFRYRVHGLPSDQEARIHNQGHGDSASWQIIRIHGDVWSDPEGNHKTAEEALAALQKEIDGTEG